MIRFLALAVAVTIVSFFLSSSVFGQTTTPTPTTTTTSPTPTTVVPTSAPATGFGPY